MSCYFISVNNTVRDHFLDESELRYLKVVVDPSGTPVTFYPMKLSCDATESYQKWSARIKNRDVYSVGQYANNDANVQISHNDTDWVTIFTGFVSDAGFRRTRGYVTDDYIRFDLVDATQRKGTKRKPPKALLSGFKICDPSNTSASILHYLADLMDATLSATEIDYTKTLVEVGDGTAWSELQKVKETFHADMYFDADGELLFVSPFDTGYSAPTSEWTFQGDPDNAVSGDACRIKGRLEETYLPVRCNYAKTMYDELEALSAQVIYKNTENYSATSDQIDIEVAAGEYWPGPNAADLAKLNFVDPESGEEFPFATSVSTPTVGTTGSGNDVEYTGGTLEIISFNGSTSATSAGADHAQIILRNTGGTTCTITKLTISGTPYRRTSETMVECIDSAVSDAVDYVEKEIDGKYAISESQVYDTLYHIKEEGKGRPRQFRFSAPFMPWIQRNAIVNVQPPGESAVRCRIDSYQHKNLSRTLQGMVTSVICTELGTHTPSGDPTLRTDNNVSPILAKITSISPNAGATYRSVSTSAPTTPQLGDLWYQTDSKLMKRYSGSSWENTGASPLEESSTAGVDFENSTGNVQILSDGTLKAVGIEAVDGEFSGVLTAASGQVGGFVSEDSEISGDTYTTSNTVQDFIDDMIAGGLSKYGGTIFATYNSKSYIRYERLEKDDVRSIGYNYTYYFYASDDTSFNLEDDDNFASDFVFLASYKNAEIRSLVYARAGIDVNKLFMSPSASIEFGATAGGNIVSNSITGAMPASYTFLTEGYKSSIEGTVRINYSMKNNYESSQNLRFKIYVGATEITQISQDVASGATYSSTYDLTIHSSEIVKFEVASLNIYSAGVFSVYVSIAETVGPFADAFAMRVITV